MSAEIQEYLLKVEVAKWEAFVLQQEGERESEMPELDDNGKIYFKKQKMKQPAIKQGLQLIGEIKESRRAHLPNDVMKGKSEPLIDDFWLDETERQEFKRNVGNRAIVMDFEERDHKVVGIVLPRSYSNEGELPIQFFVKPGFLSDFIVLASKEVDINVVLKILGIAQAWNSNTEGLEVTMVKLMISGGGRALTDSRDMERGPGKYENA